MSTHSVSGLWNSMTCGSLGEKERMPRMESFSMLVMAAAFWPESLAHGHFPPPRSSGASSALLHSRSADSTLGALYTSAAVGRGGGKSKGAPEAVESLPPDRVQRDQSRGVALHGTPSAAASRSARVAGVDFCHNWSRMAGIDAALRCGHCSSHLCDSHVLPCSHRFCAGCLRSIPGRLCPSCKVPFFENDLIPDPYVQGVLDKFASLVDQLREAKLLRERGVLPGRQEPPLEAPRVLTGEALAAAEEQEFVLRRMQVLEKRLRAQQAIIVANVQGPLAGLFDFAQPAPPKPELLRTPARLGAKEQDAQVAGPAVPEEAPRSATTSEQNRIEPKQTDHPRQQEQQERQTLGQEPSTGLSTAAAMAPRGGTSRSNGEAVAQPAERMLRIEDGGGGGGGGGEDRPSPLGKRVRASLEAGEEEEPPERSKVSKFVFCWSGLDKAEIERVKKLVAADKKLPPCVFLKEWRGDVSHVLTTIKISTNAAVGARLCGRTMKYMTALANGRWIVGTDWVDASKSAGYWIDEKPFEFEGDTVQPGPSGRGTSGPRRNRQAHEQSKPPLLMDYNVAMLGEDGTKVAAATMLVRALGGNICDAAQLVPLQIKARRGRSSGSGDSAAGDLQGGGKGKKPMPLPGNKSIIISHQRLDLLSTQQQGLFKQLSGKVPIVNSEWLFDSLSSGCLLEETDEYPPR